MNNIGGQARVLVGANVRQSPGLRDKPTGDVIDLLQVGMVVTLEQGPRGVDDLNWWLVNYSAGRSGWVAESARDGTAILTLCNDIPPSDFERAVTFVLAWEGGYVNNPVDPGGETNWGISRRSYPNLDIRNLTVAQAKEIYRTDYWLRAGCDALAWPLSLMHFDTAVNCGVSKANQFLAIAAKRLDLYTALRLEFYAGLGTFSYFGSAWVRRVADLLKSA